MFALRRFSKSLVKISPRNLERLRLTARLMSEQKVERPEGIGLPKNPGKGEKLKFTWRMFFMSGATLGACIGTYLYVKDLKVSQIEAERKRQIGKARIGGPFELIDTEGKPKGSKDFLGKWSLIYFGFTHCPDICPDEMEKMAEVVDVLKAAQKSESYIGDLAPIFISVDPVRDTIDVVKEYIKEFHPDLIGLTGSEEKVKEACKNYRVYFSAGPADEDNDYIVDHTIIMYLVDPEGNFVDYYGQRKTAQEVSTSVKLHMQKYEKEKQGKSWLFG